MRSFLVVSSICFLVLGCSNPPAAVDAGGDGGNLVVDSGSDAAVVVDGGSDAGSDAGPALCGTATCTPSQACVRDVCIDTCGATTATWDTALAADLDVRFTVCRSASALTFAGGHIYELNSTTAGMVTTFVLTRYTPAAGVTTFETVGMTTYTAAAGSTMVYTGGYVAVSADESHAVFGYTTSLTGYVGGVFDLTTGGGAMTEVSADANLDAAFGDATHYYVDGAPGGMNGLFRGTAGGTTLTPVVSHLGDASGSVELWGDEHVVLAGGAAFVSAWADGMMGNRVLVLDPVALAAVTTTPIDGATVQQIDMPSVFELLSGGRAATAHYQSVSPYAVDAIEVRTLTRATGGMVTASAPTNLTTGTEFFSVTAAGPDIVLGFAGGLLFVH